MPPEPGRLGPGCAHPTLSLRAGGWLILPHIGPGGEGCRSHPPVGFPNILLPAYVGPAPSDCTHCFYGFANKPILLE